MDVWVGMSMHGYATVLACQYKPLSSVETSVMSEWALGCCAPIPSLPAGRPSWLGEFSEFSAAGAEWIRWQCQTALISITRRRCLCVAHFSPSWLQHRVDSQNTSLFLLFPYLSDFRPPFLFYASLFYSLPLSFTYNSDKHAHSQPHTASLRQPHWQTLGAFVVNDIHTHIRRKGYSAV